MENKTYHSIGKFPKSNRKLVERVRIDTPSTPIYNRSLSGIGTSSFMDQHMPSETMRSSVCLSKNT